MKRKIAITWGFVFIALFLFFFIYFYTNESSEDVANDKAEQDNTTNQDEGNKENGEEESNEEKSSLEVMNEEILESMNEKMDRFEHDGSACQTIEDVIVRGDCFQMINSNYIDWVIDTSKGEFYFPSQREQVDWEDIFYYTINNDKLDEVQETDYYDKHENANKIIMKRGIRTIEEYWHIFSNFIPQEFRPDLTQVIWMDTSNHNLLAIGQNEKNLTKNMLILSHNLGQYNGEVKSLVLHEFAHILTLNAQQLHVLQDEDITDAQDLLKAMTSDWSTYYSMWGCIDENSYLYAYYEAFWQDIMGTFEDIVWKSEKIYKNFFYANEDRFFNNYQDTSPEVDIAEAFSQFIMISKREIDAVKYEKLDYFYQYDE